MISDLCCDAGLVLGTLHVLPHLITTAASEQRLLGQSAALRSLEGLECIW